MSDRITHFHKAQLGSNSAYLIRGEDGCVMVDGGNILTGPLLERALIKQGLDYKDIKLVVVTHAHFDHVGIVKEIKERSGCLVAVHEKERALLSDGVTVIPPSTNAIGRAIGFLGHAFKNTWLLGFEAVEPDITISAETSLEPFGIAGRILPTPGHSEGSVSVLLDSGEAFVGDLAFDYLPFEFGIFPPFAGDADELFRSWELLVDAGAKRIFPGHGGSFEAERLIRTTTRMRPSIEYQTG